MPELKKRNLNIDNVQTGYRSYRNIERMTCALYFFQQRLTIVRCVYRQVSIRLLRKIMQSLQKTMLETIWNSIVSFLIGSYSTDRPNLHSEFPCIHIMQRWSIRPEAISVIMLKIWRRQIGKNYKKENTIRQSLKPYWKKSHYKVT